MTGLKIERSELYLALGYTMLSYLFCVCTASGLDRCPSRLLRLRGMCQNVRNSATPKKTYQAISFSCDAPPSRALHDHAMGGQETTPPSCTRRKSLSITHVLCVRHENTSATISMSSFYTLAWCAGNAYRFGRCDSAYICPDMRQALCLTFQIIWPVRVYNTQRV
ncbi:hypothetical protein BD311DRAFT_321426 [Dichomitus squalens]|uniref:Uncharacterized protein n=1 Tax=Dichomitus squalens TaxID=114155 RepID=A0A4Q9MNE0_9APHY|nr:hypothetical protein BD311DRAFT_321426 [Dichomitus squalens]